MAVIRLLGTECGFLGLDWAKESENPNWAAEHISTELNSAGSMRGTEAFSRLPLK